MSVKGPAKSSAPIIVPPTGSPAPGVSPGASPQTPWTPDSSGAGGAAQAKSKTGFGGVPTGAPASGSTHVADSPGPGGRVVHVGPNPLFSNAAAPAPVPAAPPPSTSVTGAEGTYLPTGYQFEFTTYSQPRTFAIGQSDNPQEPPQTATYGYVGEAGKPLTFEYQNGANSPGLQKSNAIEVQYKLAGSDQVQTLALGNEGGSSDFFTGTLQVPSNASGKLEFWFKKTQADGSTLYDSNYGTNYQGEVIPAGGTNLDFQGNWQTAQSGPIKAGSTLRFDYNPQRLVSQMEQAFEDGYQTYQISAMVSFDGKPAVEVPLVAMPDDSQGTAHLMESAIRVPDDAKSVSVYFKGHDVTSNLYYDSRYGQNYRFDVQSN
jgi:hypothetical protein